MSSFWNKLSTPFTALAPMEDVSDSVFRRVILRAGRPDVFFTEFTNAAGMCSEGRDAVIHRLDYTPDEHPIVAQIWGTVPENFYSVAKEIAEMGFDGIDINMGCPVKKIIKTGSCSALIDNPSLARELVDATKQGAGALPVSVKTRLGFKTRKTESWTRFLLELEPAALTMHGRTARETTNVPADWEAIRRVVEIRDEMNSDAVVIGNGDITSRSQVQEARHHYGVDGVMIGRGVLQNLFVFRPGTTAPADFADLSAAKKITYYIDHVRLYRRRWTDDRACNVVKKFARVYLGTFPGAAAVRRDVMEAETYDEMLRTLERYRREYENRRNAPE